VYTLPIDDGNNDEVLTSNGVGVLSWKPRITGNVTSTCATVNKVPKMSSGTNLICSQIWDGGIFVGINTVLPQDKLHIVHANPRIFIDGSIGGSSYAGVRARTGIGGIHHEYFYGVDQYNTWEIYDNTVGGNAGKRFWIEADGRVGIGYHIIPASTPCLPAARLFVKGGIFTEGLLVAPNPSNCWPDYVFDSEYKLKTLAELSTYIKDNQHLPGIPSSKEVNKDGINVGDMQAKQMEKIEELTLYIIEMKQEIDALKKMIPSKENEELKSSIIQLKK
jgi:hypothetical protein